MAKTYMINGAEIRADLIDPERKRDEAIVRRSMKAYVKYQKALNEYNEYKRSKLLPIFERRIKGRDKDETERKGDKAITFYTLDRKSRLLIRQALNVSMDYLALEAKRIIDRKIEETRKDLSGEDAELITILTGMFLERNRISFNSGIALFIKMRLTDPDLKKAQELLIQSMNADIGRLSITCEEKDREGRWEKVGS